MCGSRRWRRSTRATATSVSEDVVSSSVGDCDGRLTTDLTGADIVLIGGDYITAIDGDEDKFKLLPTVDVLEVSDDED